MSSAIAPRIGIAMGDPARISPELLAKLLAKPELMARAAVTVFGDRRILEAGERIAGVRHDLPLAASPDGAAVLGQPVFVDLMHLDPAGPPGEGKRGGAAPSPCGISRKRCWPRRRGASTPSCSRPSTNSRSSGAAIHYPDVKSAGLQTCCNGKVPAANTTSLMASGMRASPRTSRCGTCPRC